jgi:hypothetical protein
MKPFAILLAAVAVAAAQGPYDAPPPAAPAVRITTGVVPDSPWTLAVDPGAGKLRVRHKQYPALQMEIDADDHRRDRHYEGVTLIIGGKRLEGVLYGAKVSLLSPDHDAGPTERLEVLAMNPTLKVRFENGSYSRLQEAGGPDPVYFEAVFSVNKKDQLEARLAGLFYIFPTRRDTSVAIETLSGRADRHVTPQTAKGYEYFEAATRVTVRDSVFGAFTLDAFIQRLQLDVHPLANTDVFELDLDHTFKDRGQRAVIGRFRLEQPLR